MILALLVAAGTRIFSYGNCTQKSKMMTRVAKQVIRRIPNRFGPTVLKTILSTASQFTDQRGKTSNRLFMLHALTNLLGNLRLSAKKLEI